MAKIFVSRKIPGTALERLKSSEHEVVVSEFDRPLTAEEFLERATGSEAVLTLLTDKIDKEVIDAIGPQLKIVSNYAVGFDNINLKDATESGVVVTNTPADEINEAVAEHAWALLLSLARRIVEADEATRKGAYTGWEPAIFLGVSLIGKTLGIIGLGRIGSMVARRSKGYDMRVLYNKRSRDEEAEKQLGVEFADFDGLLAESDFVSLHVPLTKETRGMMNKETLAKMKKGSYLINTSRGAVVKEQDLADALRDGHLAGVALDVYENEPNINAELIGMENVVLTPHIASATVEAREKYGQLAVGAILDLLNGKKPAHIVNKDVWESRRK
jgi:glyoxylate reductase